jgi:hypothetical protein
LLTIFNPHIRFLWLIRAVTFFLPSLKSLLLPYCTLVRHKLQYASVARNSITATDASKLDRIWRMFVSVCHRRFFSHFEYDYVNVLNYLKFHILGFWRRHLEALFRCVRKIAKSDFTFMTVCLSVRTYVWNNSAPPPHWTHFHKI